MCSRSAGQLDASEAGKVDLYTMHADTLPAPDPVRFHFQCAEAEIGNACVHLLRAGRFCA
jgi:hypothetical protein